MSGKILNCPRCQGAMDIGAIADNTYGGQFQSRWYEGVPNETFWSGFKTDGDEVYKIVTYRCRECGYLESYALDETQKDSIFKSLFKS